MRDTVWIIADSRVAELPLIGMQYAQLMGLGARTFDAARSSLGDYVVPAPRLILAGYRTLAALDQSSRRLLNILVRRGATLYVRGGFTAGARCALGPFADLSFRCEPGRDGSGWRLTDDPLVPAVLANEEVRGEFCLPALAEPDGQARPLAVAHRNDGTSGAFIFAVACGAGVTICDLQADRPVGAAQAPLLMRLAHGAERGAEIGGLLAARIAAGKDPLSRPAFNVSIDDRPANHDYFTSGRLRRWLEHVNRLMPGVRLDFAWVPQQSRPASRYIEVLRRFNTGFVWHGLHRHVDHSNLPDLRAEFRQGRRQLASLRRSYGVEFQPILIFPFERFNRALLDFLADNGFLATLKHNGEEAEPPGDLVSFLWRSGARDERYRNCIPVLRRYAAPALRRDMMVALMALELPILASAHPDNLGLQRWAFMMPRAYGRSYLDHALRFAAEKQLKPQSLEEIAREVLISERTPTCNPRRKPRMSLTA